MNAKTKTAFGLPSFAALILALSGCGGGGSGGDESSHDNRNAVDYQMQIGIPYRVSANDRLVVTSPQPAVVQVSHSLSPDRHTVTLVSGSAELLQ